jgi:hypothetical protein
VYRVCPTFGNPDQCDLQQSGVELGGGGFVGSRLIGWNVIFNERFNKNYEKNFRNDSPSQELIHRQVEALARERRGARHRFHLYKDC